MSLITSRGWALPVLALVAGLAFACGGDSYGPSSASVSVSPSPSSVETSVQTATPVPTITVPDDWGMYQDPGGYFTLRYPPVWSEDGNDVSSTDPATWSQGVPPAESIDVKTSEATYDGKDCGALKYDAATNAVSPEAGATALNIGGVAAWEIVREPGDPTLDAPFTRIHEISVAYKGHCFLITAYFTQALPDEETVAQIIGSFQFKF